MQHTIQYIGMLEEECHNNKGQGCVQHLIVQNILDRAGHQTGGLVHAAEERQNDQAENGGLHDIALEYHGPNDDQCDKNQQCSQSGSHIFLSFIC